MAVYLFLFIHSKILVHSWFISLLAPNIHPIYVKTAGIHHKYPWTKQICFEKHKNHSGMVKNSDQSKFWTYHCTKNEVFHLGQFPADLFTFTEEILNVKLHFLCSACSSASELYLNIDFLLLSIILFSSLKKNLDVSSLWKSMF